MDNLKEKVKSAYEYGEGSFQKLSKKYNVKLGTIKSWAKRDKDEGNQWFKVATKDKKPNSKKVAAEKKVAEVKKKDTDMQNEVINKAVEKLNQNKELNEKQKLFCIYYIKCFNATKAYRKAYGCAYESAMVCGSQLLSNPKIRAEIERLKADKLKGAMLSANDLLQKYIDIALSDIKDYMKWGHNRIPMIDKKTGLQELDEKGKPMYWVNNYVSLNNSDEVDGTLITEVKEGKDGVSIKLIDKQKALDFLAKYKSLLDAPTQQKLDIERRKMELLEKNADNLDEDVDYVVEGGSDENQEEN